MKKKIQIKIYTRYFINFKLKKKTDTKLFTFAKPTNFINDASICQAHILSFKKVNNVYRVATIISNFVFPLQSKHVT